MQVETKNLDNGKCLVDVKMDKFEVDRETNAVSLSIRSGADIPGFRKGNAPLDVVKNRFRNKVLASTAEKLVYQGTSNALREKKLRNVSNPELPEEYRVSGSKTYLGKFNLDGTFSFSVLVELPPDIEVKDYKGVSVKIPSQKSSFENWFSGQVAGQRRLYGKSFSVNRPAANGDEVVIDFEEVHSSDPPSKTEGYRFTLGSFVMPAEFEREIIGRPLGEEIRFNIKFDDNEPDEKFKGRACEFVCKINEVYEVAPCDLDDEFATLSGYNSIEDMKKAYKETWEAEFSHPIRLQVFNAVADKVLQSNSFDVPKVWVDKEFEAAVKRLGITGLRGNENAMQTLRTISERTVKIAYILDKIYEKEVDIHLSADDFIKIASDAALKDNISGVEFIQRLKNNGTYEGFVVLQEQERAIELLVSSAVVEELN